jgi:tripartite-type tricarboxylate transporter receptor subunit TctC
MKLPRRQFLHLAAGAAALPAASQIAWAQTYPTRPVHLVVGFVAGGIADVFARLIGQRLSQRLGQPFVVENRTGVAGNIATDAVVKAAPDGYTLLLINATNTINATLYENLNFSFTRDIAPVASISRGPGVLVVSPMFPAKSISEFIAYARANPGKINMGSAGSGSTQHIYGELFKSMAGVDMLHVPYRSGPQALIELIGGQVQVIFDPLANSVEFIRAGKLRPLAVTTATRSEMLPDVPTIGEFVPGYEASGWQGIGAPRGTPNEIIERLSNEVNAGLADPTMKARTAALGYASYASSRADFAKFIADETEKWGKVIRAANIKPD